MGRKRGQYRNTYAVYKNDELVVMGTSKECADFLGILPITLRQYSYPSIKKNLRNIEVVRVEDDEMCD